MTINRETERRKTSDYFIVFDRNSGEPIGRLLDLSATGARLMTDDPIDISALLECRMLLPDIVEGCREIIFDAESRWCHQNKVTCWYESGIQFSELTDLTTRVIKRLIRDYMTADTPKSPSAYPQM